MRELSFDIKSEAKLFHTAERACSCLKVYIHTENCSKNASDQEGELDQIITAGSVFQSFYFNLLRDLKNKSSVHCRNLHTEVPVR